MKRRSSEPKLSEVTVQSKVILCRRCEAPVAMLVFAGKANYEQLEAYAYRMYIERARHKIPTWIVGPQEGKGPAEDRIAHVLMLWPVREMRRLTAAVFDGLLHELKTEHCR
jgi:hypothetical protein